MLLMIKEYMAILRKYEESKTGTPPKSKNELQTFIGVVIYHAQFLPHLATASAPLWDLLSPNQFQWRPLHEEAFQQIKHLAKNITTLRPIDYQSTNPIYLFTDASKVGAGAWIRQ